MKLPPSSCTTRKTLTRDGATATVEAANSTFKEAHDEVSTAYSRGGARPLPRLQRRERQGAPCGASRARRSRASEDGRPRREIREDGELSRLFPLLAPLARGLPEGGRDGAGHRGIRF